MPWVNPEDLAAQKEFYKARGATRVIMMGDSKRFWAIWPWKCPHPTKIGCDIYEHRPTVCREYDGRADPLMRGICKLPERKLIVLPGKGERV
jgi:Fe-S-cluster containining protein